MNAVILAGGFGSRLKPLTDDCPKPMLPVAGRPMLDYTVAQLNAFGINQMTFTLGYKADRILRFVGSYKSIESSFYIETTPLGTCGGVRAACGACSPVFFVLSGDALNDVDLAALLRKHYMTGAEVTMAVARVERPSLYGVVEFDESGQIAGFVEKPKHYTGEAWVNTGVYCINKSILDCVPENCKFDFARDLFPVLLASGDLAAYKHEGYWTDIGDVNSYYRANFDMLDGGFYPFVPNVNIDLAGPPDAAGSLYSRNAVIDGACDRSIVGKSVITTEGDIERCIVLDDTVVRGKYRNCIIGKDFTVPIAVPNEIVENNHKIFEKQLL